MAAAWWIEIGCPGSFRHLEALYVDPFPEDRDTIPPGIILYKSLEIGRHILCPHPSCVMGRQRVEMESQSSWWEEAKDAFQFDFLIVVRHESSRRFDDGIERCWTIVGW